ncbi:MAG: archaeosine synthase subunit alpha [Candidatus Syntropharchaeia archaeon]
MMPYITPMTKYFEVRKRDGPARIGRLMLEENIETPFIVTSLKEDPIVSMGSIFKRKFERTDSGLNILPHGPFSLHTKPDFSMDEEVLNLVPEEMPRGVVIHPFYPEIVPADVYVIACARQLENPSDLVRSILNIKKKVPPDSAVYAPFLATPENLALLVYLGIDLVDNFLVRMKGYEGIYLTTEGEFRYKELDELPCVCEACRRGDLKGHNVLKLEEEMKKVKELIRRGILREYVEKQCRSKPWMITSLRLVDAEYEYLEKRTPVARNAVMFANSMESLNRIEVKRFAYRIQERLGKKKGTLVLLPCSAKKPYSTSPSHRKFIEALGKYRRFLHEAIITSPLGVVPRELELTYPAAHYDVPVTGHWDEEEKKWVKECLGEYIGKNEFDRIIAHVDGGYKEICESVSEETGIEMDFTCVDIPTSDVSLRRLRSAVSEISGERMEKKREMLRDIGDYQFGRGCGERIVPDGARIKKYEVYLEGKMMARLNFNYGLFRLTLEGGKRLMDLNSYQVRIEDFIPRDSVLAPGVVEADPQIRVNDEVIIVGEKAFGVGRAMMSGWEMVESDRGVAVEVREIQIR